ncbi:MAG: type II CAAX endopeptidase family protein [Bacteroidota bacterium]|nr:type II CAAX endopeptidase family protein [Bacteroidota bacterium]
MSIQNQPNGQYLQRLIMLCGLFFLGLFVFTFLAAAAAVKIYGVPCEIYNLFDYIKSHPNEARTINALIFTQVMSQITAMAVPFLVVMQVTYRDQMYSETGLLKVPKFIIILLVLVLFVATLYPQNYLEYFNSLLFERNKEQSGFITAMIKADNSSELLINIAFMALLPALCEEFFFRGGVYLLLKKLTSSVWLPAIVSSLFFAITHDQPSQIIVIFLMGLMLAFVYELTGSLWANILLHFSNNLFFVIADYNKMDSSFDVESTYNIFMFIFSVIIIIGVFWYLHKEKKRTITLQDNSL